MSESKPFRAGGALNGSEVVALIEEHDATQCRAMIACEVEHVRSGTNVVLLVLAADEGEPVAFAPIPCIHGVEVVIDRLRAAAALAFSDQPCTICERVE